MPNVTPQDIHRMATGLPRLEKTDLPALIETPAPAFSAFVGQDPFDGQPLRLAATALETNDADLLFKAVSSMLTRHRAGTPSDALLLTPALLLVKILSQQGAYEKALEYGKRAMKQARTEAEQAACRAGLDDFVVLLSREETTERTLALQIDAHSAAAKAIEKHPDNVMTYAANLVAMGHEALDFNNAKLADRAMRKAFKLPVPMDQVLLLGLRIAERTREHGEKDIGATMANTVLRYAEEQGLLLLKYHANRVHGWITGEPWGVAMEKRLCPHRPEGSFFQASPDPAPEHPGLVAEKKRAADHFVATFSAHIM